MDYEQIIANLQKVLFNQSRTLAECQARIRDLEEIVGVKEELPKEELPNEVIYGYLDESEDGRIIHSDLVSNKSTEYIYVKCNLDNEITLFTDQLNYLKTLKNIEIHFDRGYSQKTKYSFCLAKKITDGIQSCNRVSADEFRKICFERGITVSFYDKNRGFYPQWSMIFTDII